MSTSNLILSNEAAIEKYNAELAERAKALSNRISAAPANVIRTKGKVFTMPDGTVNPGPLRAVVIDFTSFNSYFDGMYDAKNPKPPVCWALGDNATLQPSKNAPKPQASACNTCAKNEWGSAPTGKGKACKNQIKLALIPSDLAAPDTSSLFTLNISPTGLKAFSAYARQVQRFLGDDALPIRTVVDIGFDPNQPFPTLTFTNIQPNNNLGVALALLKDAKEMLDREPSAAEE